MYKIIEDNMAFGVCERGAYRLKKEAVKALKEMIRERKKEYGFTLSLNKGRKRLAEADFTMDGCFWEAYDPALCKILRRDK